MKVCILSVPAMFEAVQMYCPMSLQVRPDISRSPVWLTLSLLPSSPTTSPQVLVQVMVVVVSSGVLSLQGKVTVLATSTRMVVLHTEISGRLD